MSKIVLSICIPTYNRGKALVKNLNHLTSFKSDEIEIVVSDNCSQDDTEARIKKIKDPRIKYFRNKTNLGFDRNLLKCCERANGMYYFFLSDEDIIDFKTLSWIIEFIKKSNNFTQIIGSVGDLRPEKRKLYYNPGDQIFKSGHNALVKILFENGYISGIILRNDAIDIVHAKNYVGIMYMHQVLTAQAMLKGDTFCTSKVFCYIGIQNKSYVTKLEKSSKGDRIITFNHPLSRTSILKFRFKLIIDITKNLHKTRRTLLNKERTIVANYLLSVFFKTPYWFFKIFPYILNIKEYSTSIIFWKNFPFQFTYEFKKLIKNKKNVNNLIQGIIAPNSYYDGK